MSTLYHSLATGDFIERWDDATRLTTNDWSLVPSIMGYRGDNLIAQDDDPRLLTGSSDVVNAVVNRSDPSSYASGGVVEFDGIADPTVAIQGSGTADSPYLVIHLDATGRENITFSTRLRDIDTGTSAVQPIAIQYRLGDTGDWLNIEGGYVANANNGGDTLLSVVLPPEANGAAQVQVRVITTDVAGSDAFIGVDDINVTSTAIDEGAPGTLSIADARVVENDAGQQIVFTVSRAGGSAGAATVDYSVSFLTADDGDFASGTPFAGTVSFAPGETSKQIVLTIADDMTGEMNERFEVVLGATTGNVEIIDGTATGTIFNDDALSLKIYEIQGRGHVSEVDGQPVITQGVVTAIDSNGFYLQDPNGDGDAATSDGIFVFTKTKPAVAVGDLLDIKGTVHEFAASAQNLTTTEIVDATWSVISTGNVIEATVIGADGRVPPSSVVDDDGMTSYDPQSDGIDFYESLEGMLVTVEGAQAVSNTNQYGETFVVVAETATGLNDRGGLTLSEGDLNPERIQIDADGVIFDGYDPAHTQGDRLGDITGVMGYDRGWYEVLVTEDVDVVEDVALGREISAIDGDHSNVTIASYNVENLDPTDGSRFNLIAGDIVWNLNSPDIIGLQEIQDADGAGRGPDLSGQATADALIAAIAAAGGPTYVYVEIAPTEPGSTGGQNGGNIRNGYLYNPERVDYVDGSAELIDGPALAGTRRPLVAQFTFNESTITAINHHATSRLGSDPTFGDNQPPIDAGNADRIAESTAIRAYVDGLTAADPAAKVVVLGDFNAFTYEPSMQLLEANGGLVNLYDTLPEAERYSAKFEGNSQPFDNILVSANLAGAAVFDAVHINSERTGAAPVASDHDPVLAKLFVPLPNKQPIAVADAVAVAEDAATANLASLLLANDADVNPGDMLSISSVDTSATKGSVVFDAATQTLVYTADADVFDLLDTGAVATDTLTYTVVDAGGLTSTATVTFTVTGVADGRVIKGGNGKDVLAGTSGEDVITGANGNDRLSGLDGADRLDGGNGRDMLDGGAGIDTLLGGRGDDTLDGGAGDDRLDGGLGQDRIMGGAGDDVIVGSNGHDLLSGGEGADTFVFGIASDIDKILDFDAGEDRIEFADGVHVEFHDIRDTNQDGTLDTVLVHSLGGVIIVHNAELAIGPSMAEYQNSLWPTQPQLAPNEQIA